MLEGFGWHDVERPELETTCCFIGTTAAIIGAIGAGIGATGSIISANKQSDAAQAAAKTTADAATAGSHDQLEANREGIAYQEQLARYQAQAAEVDRQANYGQYAAKQRKLGSLGQMLGLGGVDVPAYVPGAPPPQFNIPGVNGAAPVPVGAGSTPAAAANAAVNPYARVPNFAAAVNRPQPVQQLPMASSMPAGNVGLVNPPPWMNDWTPRDPKTGQPLYGSLGAMAGVA